MTRLPLIISCLALLVSLFAVHVAFHTRNEMQMFAHSLGKLK
jgi:hypothetical protein